MLLLVGWIGAFTALLAAVLACVQSDIKRVLAYSTVSQLGYMMAAMGAGFAAAGFLHLLTHGIFKALLFLGAGAVIHAVGSNDIYRMGGLRRHMPQTTVVFLVGTLSLAGIPLFGGFFSKEEILGAVWSGGLAVPFCDAGDGGLPHRVLHVPGGLHRLLRRPRRPRPSRTGARRPRAHGGGHLHDAPAVMTLPLWLLAVLVGGDRRVLHRASPASPSSPRRPGSARSPIAVAVGGIALAWLTYQRRVISAGRSSPPLFAPIRRAALARFWLDDLFEAVYRGAILGFSRVVGWMDRYLVDGVVNVCSAWTLDARAIACGACSPACRRTTCTALAVGLLLLLDLGPVAAMSRDALPSCPSSRGCPSWGRVLIMFGPGTTRSSCG